MAGKFIEIKAAAKQLGISVEALQDLREAGKIHGYKDGTSWKFKPEELERVATELSDARGADADDLSFADSASFSGDDLDELLRVDAIDDREDNLEDSSILLSDAIDDEEQSSSSTIIGKDSKTAGQDEASDLKLVDGGVESDVTLPSDDEHLGEASDMKGRPGSSEADYDLRLADSEDLSDELLSPDELDFESDSALMLADDSHIPSSDEEVVLGDSKDEASAIAAEDSGVGLASPSDSGLSLEEQASAEALELPEDDDMISLRDDLMDASDDSSPLQQDEEFLLSPSDEMLGDESSDSGSQVIALDDSGAFEEDSAVTALESDEPMLIPDDVESLDAQLEPIESAVAVASKVPLASAEVPEAGYTAWNLSALLLVVVLLSLSGMLMADIVRNMWSWSGDTAVTSGLATSIVDSLGMR